MTTIEEQLMIERRGHAASVARRRTNFVIFLGPAIVLTVLFFGVPVIIDIAVSFTDLSRSLRITEFTTEQYEKVFRTDRRLSQVIGLTFIYVFGTLAIFNVTFGLILAITTTAIRNASGSFFRGVWLLPRMSPSVLYILLWLWAVSPTEAGLVNQVLMQAFGLDAPLDLLTSAPIALIIISNGFIGASMGMIIFTAAIRSIPEHLFHAAAVDGAGTFATIRFITLPALRWPISFVTIYQTLSLLVSFEYILLLTKGGPFYDTTVYALYVYRRAFESGQYGYGAALALFLIVIGVVVALLGWRFFDMERLLQRPRIEVH
ncbi:carbohydrate ABC transporter permease [Rhizobium giardinii]|jgi:inositol-phosphate transport system permease protein|uniref:Inositol-phosphate transport system permease protein n=1 Tax=Rhizobium giardinii TaxID=56731 RepID=A0A7W8UEE0_9HYPH|nr:sugar ABC transporter permease [Rhizobium giardinii]MBB5537713.1 inositol-phosphate transport system permease protein [Rhizobium giardinii]